MGLVLAGREVKKQPNGQPDGVGDVALVILLDKIGTDGVSNVQIRGVPDNVMTFRPNVKIVDGRPAQPGGDGIGEFRRWWRRGLGRNDRRDRRDRTRRLHDRRNRPTHASGNNCQ